MGRLIEPHHVWRRHPVDELGLLVDGADYYRELYRAALTAKKCLLLVGWQFDSDVELLRGPEALASETPVAFLEFLDYLCRTRPNLRVCVMAWDFNVVFAAEREWMQEIVFHWHTHERISFRFDRNHVKLGSLHQKYVVVDDELVFTGGLDICDHRWDDGGHRFDNPLRQSRGLPHQPYHDLQVLLRGHEVTATFKQLFARRWADCGGEPLDALFEGPALRSPYRPERTLPIAASEITLSRTDPFAVPEGQRPCTEVLKLYLHAIANADHLIYVETQYFSSKAITDALEARLKDARRPKLQLVFILNMRGKTLREQAAVGLAQAQNVARLRRVAAQTGHRVGFYYTLPHGERHGAPPERGTYIHSKIMIVDDRFMTVGSANLTNRSMGVDTELNVNLEAVEGDEELVRSIRATRVALLAHATALGEAVLAPMHDLVERLETAMGPDGDACRLRRIPGPNETESAVLEIIDPDKLPFDPYHVENFDTDQRDGLFKALARAMRVLLSSARTPSSESS